MVLYPVATSADSPLAHVVVHPLQLALVVLFHPPTGANTALALGQLALCGYIYTYTMVIAQPLELKYCEVVAYIRYTFWAKMASYREAFLGKGSSVAHSP